MLPLFPHEDQDRARQIAERLLSLAQAYWEANDPPRFKENPFAVMMVALFSPRTRTEDSRAAMEAIFTLADTPEAVAQLSHSQVVMILTAHDVRFPEDKARHLLDSAAKLAQSGGSVPRDLDSLMQYPGMGWKTSLLTLHLAYNLAPEICVDVHVARIGQRIGLVRPTTRKAQKVSRELMDIVPQTYWRWWNSIMVYFGKTRCTPTQPRCQGCPIYDLCERVGVR